MKSTDIQIQIPGYQIVRQIGEGGMSVVYLAFQESLKREVALKVMRPVVVGEGNVFKRFKQEAEIIAKLYHPNIVSIYDVGTLDDHVLYYSMPYLQHGDLTSFSYHNDEELIRVMSSLCQGLAFAHAQGVVHRDIKPENILFDQFGNVKIADFGIALSSGSRRFTKEQRIVGSIHYLSPEQARSKHVDARSDIYGLGAILYEVLTGQPVFDEEDDLAIMMAHVEKPVPRLPKKVAHWQPIIDKCLAKSPNQRFQSIHALQEAIESLSPEVALGPIKRLQAWPYLVAIGVLCVVVVLVLWFSTTQLSDDKLQTAGNTPIQTEFVTANQTPEKEAILSSKNEAEDLPEPQLTDSETHELLTAAKDNIDRKQLTTPTDNNALDKILTVLADQRNNNQAREMLSAISDGYFDLVYRAVVNHNLNQVEVYADSVATVRHKVALVDEGLLQQLEAHSEMTVSLLLGTLAEQVRTAVDNYNQPLANQLVELTDRLMPGHRIVDELYAELEQLPPPGQQQLDAMGIASVLVVPPKSAAINYGFHVTTTEITYGQYRTFINDTERQPEKCKSRLKTNFIFSQRTLDNPGFPVTDNMPVVCVTWKDAQDYARWLSQKTDRNYQLLSHDHWQAMTAHLTALECGRDNVAGQEFGETEEGSIAYSCDDDFARLAPAKAFPKDNSGLYGLQGNAQEWLSGCESLGKLKAFFKPDQKCDSNPAAGLSWLATTEANGEPEDIKNGEAWTHIGFRLMYRN